VGGNLGLPFPRGCFGPSCLPPGLIEGESMGKKNIGCYTVKNTKTTSSLLNVCMHVIDENDHAVLRYGRNSKSEMTEIVGLLKCV